MWVRQRNGGAWRAVMARREATKQSRRGAAILDCCAFGSQ
jgi:hypothetical protein